jgi:hypothetical protein
MTRTLAGLVATAVLVGAVGCSQGPPAKAPGLPPTPKSVTTKNPGGDAADPEKAALERLVAEPWGMKYDRYRTIKVSLIDSRHWMRVKLWHHPTRAAFRFGDQHYGIVALWYQPMKDGKDDPDTCLTKFLAENTPEAEALGARVSSAHRVHTEQLVDGEPQPVAIELMEGSIDSMLASNDYVGALAAYQSWPGTCLIQGVAFSARHHRELALKARERWVNEGIQRLRWDPEVTSAPTFRAR